MKSTLIFLACAGLFLATHVTLAHHSAAMFERTRTVTLQGTIKEYQFENPHIWIEIMVPDEDGNVQQWSIEGEGRTSMVRMGLGRKTINPGDKVTIRAHPLRDGRPGGSFIEITLPDGKLIKAHQPQAGRSGQRGQGNE